MNECHCVHIRRLQPSGNKVKQVILIIEINYQRFIQNATGTPYLAVFFRESDEDQVMSN